MDNICAKFGDYSFSRFIVRLYTVGVSNKMHNTCSSLEDVKLVVAHSFTWKLMVYLLHVKLNAARSSR